MGKNKTDTDKDNDTPAEEYQHFIFEQVLADELDYLYPGNERRFKRNLSDEELNRCDSDYAVGIVKDAHKAKLSGIAFSGGGIRSATFNLGVLQALAKLGLLKEFDYLSTVSGGGYIGSWLSAWLQREKDHNESRTPNPSLDPAPTDPLGRVSNALAASTGGGENLKSHASIYPDPAPIRHLREYSNYLTPRRGAWSTDTWALGAAYVRNLLLTLSVLLGAVAVTVFFIQAIAAGYDQVLRASIGKNLIHGWPLLTWSYLLSVALISAASAILGYELSPHRSANATSVTSAYVGVVITLISAMTMSIWLASVSPDNKLGFLSLLGATVPLAVFTIIFGYLGYYAGQQGWFACESYREVKQEGSELPRSKSDLAYLTVGGILAILALMYMWWGLIRWWGHPEWQTSCDRLVVWGVPLVVLTYNLAIAISVGFSALVQRELEREWLARFSGALVKWTVLYIVLMALIVYSYHFVEQFPYTVQKWLDNSSSSGGKVNPILTTLWAIISGLGALLARNAPSNKSGLRRIGRNLLLAVAPVIFIIGLFVIVTWALTYLGSYAYNELHWSTLPSVEYGSLLQAKWYWITASELCALTLFITLIWSNRVGVNDFSIHAIYGNRLIRAYLGASDVPRIAHPFTGFATADNSVHMAELLETHGQDSNAVSTPDATSATTSPTRQESDRGNTTRSPYLIVNAAVNLVSGKRLAWQQRKAGSFTFTPKYCGYEFCNDEHNGLAQGSRVGGYARSESYGGKQGISLGKAMTISGAAASPNMGYHSSPALGFLMTTFNVRLGWWLPNTAKDKVKLLAKRGPGLGLLYLFKEAMGMTNARSNHVYLSDGGHFENLGIYELVRRRCRLIIASDAEQDNALTFSGLGNAIEKCRTDLGVPITIDVNQIRKDLQNGKSRWHCAIGCIRYSEADPGQHDGALLYIKSSLTGDEPQDVETYAESHPGFPHESTADQWFNESQFESYRALGEHIALRTLANAHDIARHDTNLRENLLERMFLELRKQWYPHTELANVKPADHDHLLQELMDRLRRDEKLSFMDSQLYPNLQRISDEEFAEEQHPKGKPTGGKDKKPEWQPGAPHLPLNAAELRAGFYFCKELIQFMQTVFHDRRLDTEYIAPSNRGWMNLFRRWALSRMFRFTWAATAGTYSARFQSFCEFHLSLDSGEVIVDEESRQEINSAKLEHWVNKHDDSGLHYYERCIIAEFINAYAMTDDMKNLGTDAKYTIYPLRIKIDGVTRKTENKNSVLNAGFFLVGPKPETGSPDKHAVLYFRIRSSMRNMDLARRAFIKIRRQLDKNCDICLVHELPELKKHDDSDSVRRRAYREVHRLERENMERCRWFSQLLSETSISEAQADET